MQANALTLLERVLVLRLGGLHLSGGILCTASMDVRKSASCDRVVGSVVGVSNDYKREGK